MSSNRTCIVCHESTQGDQVVEEQRVPSNVRAFSDELFTVWRCGSCRSIHAVDDVDLAWYYAKYPIRNQTLNTGSKLLYRNRRRDLLRHGAPPGEVTVLDFGCGHGLYVQYLRSHGYVADGFDTFVLDYADEAILDEVFDVVESAEVIEHAEDPVAFLESMAACVRPGGLLIVRTPVSDHIDLADFEQHQSKLHQPYHRHLLSERSLVEIGESIGLELVEFSREHYGNTRIPGVNVKFLSNYVRRAGNQMDVLFERPDLRAMFGSAEMLRYFVAGSFSPPPGDAAVFFRKAG
jgi:2-polyprenyl-3-methyl-5-hydroxy-6-metoxy-1,4-benzoquinol methylase